MTRGYEACLLTTDEYDAWDRFVAAASEGSPYHATEYLDVLCRCGGGDFRVLGVYQGEELVGGVPLYERPCLTGRHVGPRLLLYYNGLVLRDYDTRYPSRVISRHLGIMEALERGIRDLGYAGVNLRCRQPRTDVRPFLESGWRVTPGYSYVVPIAETDALWDRIDNNLRRLVGRAAEHGIELTEDDDFASFFRMHRRVSEEKGAPIYLAHGPFERYVRTLRRKGMMQLFHARLPSGESVSASLVLSSDHPVTHTIAAAADPAHYETGASPYLRWRTFEVLAERGHVANDLTDASLNSVSRFKRQLGGDLALNLVLQSERALRRVERRATASYWRIRGKVGAVGRSGWKGVRETLTEGRPEGAPGRRDQR